MSYNDWKTEMEENIRKALKNRSMHPQIAENAKECFSKNMKFRLLYNNSRECYMGLQLIIEERTNKFSKTKKELLLKLVKAEIEEAIDEFKYRVKTKTLNL